MWPKVGGRESKAGTARPAATPYVAFAVREHRNFESRQQFLLGKVAVAGSGRQLQAAAAVSERFEAKYRC